MVQDLLQVILLPLTVLFYMRQENPFEWIQIVVIIIIASVSRLNYDCYSIYADFDTLPINQMLNSVLLLAILTEGKKIEK